MSLPLFDPPGEPLDDAPDLVGMVHRGDPHTSREAAEVIQKHQTELHAKVLEAFRMFGPMTDEQLEQLVEFRGYGPSTIRKRRSELYQADRLSVVGERVNTRGRKMLVWGMVLVHD